MAGCDLVPFVHSMPFMKMWGFAVSFVEEDRLLANDIVELDVTG